MIEPRWLSGPSGFIGVDREPDPDVISWFDRMPVSLEPGSEDRFDALEGQWVRISGHFHDAAAATCRVVHGEPPVAPDAGTAVRICETAFVVTSIVPLELPPTDGATPPRTFDGGIAVRLGVVGLMVSAAAGVVLRRRTSED